VNSYLFRLIYTFLMGGVMSLRGDTEEQPSGDQIDALIQALATPRGSKSSRAGFVTPFELLMERHYTPEVEKSQTLFVECMQDALEDTKGEILETVPESKVTTKVERVDNEEYHVYEGHIEWVIDKYTQHVYPICVDLMRDGFMFMPNTKTFVITAKVLK